MILNIATLMATYIMASFLYGVKKIRWEVMTITIY